MNTKLTNEEIQKDNRNRHAGNRRWRTATTASSGAVRFGPLSLFVAAAILIALASMAGSPRAMAEPDARNLSNPEITDPDCITTVGDVAFFGARQVCIENYDPDVEDAQKMMKQGLVAAADGNAFGPLQTVPIQFNYDSGDADIELRLKMLRNNPNTTDILKWQVTGGDGSILKTAGGTELAGDFKLITGQESELYYRADFGNEGFIPINPRDLLNGGYQVELVCHDEEAPAGDPKRVICIVYLEPNAPVTALTPLDHRLWGVDLRFPAPVAHGGQVGGWLLLRVDEPDSEIASRKTLRYCVDDSQTVTLASTSDETDPSTWELQKIHNSYSSVDINKSGSGFQLIYKIGSTTYRTVTVTPSGSSTVNITDVIDGTTITSSYSHSGNTWTLTTGSGAQTVTRLDEDPTRQQLRKVSLHDQAQQRGSAQGAVDVHQAVVGMGLDQGRGRSRLRQANHDQLHAHRQRAVERRVGSRTTFPS